MELLHFLYIFKYSFDKRERMTVVWYWRCSQGIPQTQIQGLSQNYTKYFPGVCTTIFLSLFQNTAGQEYTEKRLDLDSAQSSYKSSTWEMKEMLLA